MITIRPTFVAMLLTLPAAQSLAEEFNAEDYHHGHCMACHDNDVYTRDDRKMKSYEMLQNQVARCDANLGAGLFPDDMDQLTNYLNDTFYKFGK